MRIDSRLSGNRSLRALPQIEEDLLATLQRATRNQNSSSARLSFCGRILASFGQETIDTDELPPSHMLYPREYEWVKG